MQVTHMASHCEITVYYDPGYGKDSHAFMLISIREKQKWGKALIISLYLYLLDTQETLSRLKIKRRIIHTLTGRGAVGTQLIF